jgi:hypothetical protein
MAAVADDDTVTQVTGQIRQTGLTAQHLQVIRCERGGDPPNRPAPSSWWLRYYHSRKRSAMACPFRQGLRLHYAQGARIDPVQARAGFLQRVDQYQTSDIQPGQNGLGRIQTADG